MTDFLRLKIAIYAYRRIADRAEFFASVGEAIEDAVTGQRGDGDWFGEVQDFFDEVRSIWKTMEEREAEGAIVLNRDDPDDYLTKVEPKRIERMGLIEVLTLLRKSTAAKPEVEEYNWTCPGNAERKPDPERDRRFITAFQKGLIVPALKRLNKLMELSPADIEAVLALKPIFDSLTGEQFRAWNGWETIEPEGGGQALHVPYPDYHPVVSQWTEAVYCTPFYIDPYREVPGKEGGVPPPRFMGLGEPGQPTLEEFFAEADLDEVRQYMSLCLRGEKWCDGFIAGEFQRGVIQASFERLERVARSHASEATEWPFIRLGDMSDLVRKQVQPVNFSGERYVALEDIDTGEPFLSRWGNTAGVRSAKTAFEAGDVLFAKLRPYLEKGVRVPFAGVCSTDLLAIRAGRELVSEFLGYLVHTRAFVEQAVKHTTGVNHPRTSWSALADFRLGLPRFDEQQCIVRTLEAIQAARLARFKEIELERERKAALMAHLFAYGTQNEPRRDTPLGPLPESWEIRTLGECLREKLKNGHSAREAADSNGIRTFTLSAVTHDDFSIKNSKVTTADAAKVKDIWVKSGDIFVERGNTPDLVGTAAMYVGPDDIAIFPDLLIRVRPRVDRLVPSFLLNYLRSERARDYCKRHASGTAGSMPKIDHSKLAAMPLPLPALEEQVEVANALDGIGAYIRALEAEAKLLDELFRAALEELMSGRLSVARLRQEVLA